MTPRTTKLIKFQDDWIKNLEDSFLKIQKMKIPKLNFCII